MSLQYSIQCFKTKIENKDFYFCFMGSGAKEVLVVEESLKKGFPRTLIKIPLGFSTWEDFKDYHEQFFGNGECVQSFIDEYVK